jgi:Mn-dependent DtxR family transcriptional regulator
MNDGLKALVLAVDEMRAEGERVTVRDLGTRLGIHYSTVQNHIKRATAAGYLQYEENRSNTLRLGPGVVVHKGEVYQMLSVET